MSDTEKWRDVEGWPYQVSTKGRIRRTTDAAGPRNWVTHPGKVLKPTRLNNGYYWITLCESPRRKKYSMHRLVAATFHGPPPTADMVVNHIDGDKSNNRPGNLEWVTQTENEKHAVMVGLKAHGRRSALAKLTEEQVAEILSRLREGHNCIRVAEHYPVTADNIRKIKAGLTWRRVLTRGGGMCAR